MFHGFSPLFFYKLASSFDLRSFFSHLFTPVLSEFLSLLPPTVDEHFPGLCRPIAPLVFKGLVDDPLKICPTVFFFLMIFDFFVSPLFGRHSFFSLLFFALIPLLRLPVGSHPVGVQAYPIQRDHSQPCFCCPAPVFSRVIHSFS